MIIIRSKSPLRISFGGGGTDVSPYFEERGGCVLTSTINRHAYATLITQSRDSVDIKSLDYDSEVKYNLNEQVKFDGKLDLAKAAIRVMGVNQGLSIFLHSDVPPGSGLGASSALTVAIVGLFKEFKQLPLTEYEIAELAYQIEREEVGIRGGKQDQYAATFGNFNFIEFFKSYTVVNTLRIKREIINELEYRLMLCYTGHRRLSAGIINDQVDRYLKRETNVIQALDYSKELTIMMKNSLLLGKLNDFGGLLHEAWNQKKQLSARITDQHIDELYDTARKYGAIGGKLLGAGGGGYLLLLCEFNKQHRVAEKLELAGGKVIKFSFEPEGLQVWRINRE